MRKRNIVIGQRVDLDKVKRARMLRGQMTEEEGILWERLRANRLEAFHFRRQQVIDGFIVDFYCHAAGLVIEVDGGVHQQQVKYDAERDGILASRGLKVIRIQNEDIRQNLEGVLSGIVAQLKKRSTSQPS